MAIIPELSPTAGDNVSRREARLAGLSRYFTGRPCKRGHLAERRLSTGHCVECNNAAMIAWRAANPERSRVISRDSCRRARAADPVKANARSNAWAKANPEKVAANHRTWYINNTERANAASRSGYRKNKEAFYTRAKAWKAANPDKVLANTWARRARKIEAMPAWTCKKSIAAVYAEAAELTRSTGIPHHIDHIVPLRSKIVCGLHVHYNLRAIPAVDNMRKHNNFNQEEILC